MNPTRLNKGLLLLSAALSEHWITCRREEAQIQPNTWFIEQLRRFSQGWMTSDDHWILLSRSSFHFTTAEREHVSLAVVFLRPLSERFPVRTPVPQFTCRHRRVTASACVSLSVLRVTFSPRVLLPVPPYYCHSRVVRPPATVFDYLFWTLVIIQLPMFLQIKSGLEKVRKKSGALTVWDWMHWSRLYQ
jgi:hypothetical protein